MEIDNNFLSVYNRLYDEIHYYVKNKNTYLDNKINYQINYVNNYNYVDIKCDDNSNESNDSNDLNDSDNFEIIDYLDNEYDEYGDTIDFNFDYKLTTKIFSCNKFLLDNLKSYNYDPKNIIAQFKLDCPRTLLLFNNHKINNIKNLKFNLNKSIKDWTKTKLKLDNKNFRLIDILIMIFNQSSYAFPYIYLNKFFNKKNNNLIVVNCADNRKIEVNTFNNEIKINIETDMLIRDMLKDEYIHKINVSINFDIYTYPINNISTNGLLMFDYQF